MFHQSVPDLGFYQWVCHVKKKMSAILVKFIDQFQPEKDLKQRQPSLMHVSEKGIMQYLHVQLLAVYTCRV
jgi:hypothetical protein